MALKSVQEEWEGFSAMIFRDVNPTKLQREEMRKAFFGGATAMLAAVTEVGVPEVSIAEGCTYLDSLHAECKKFYEDLVKEYTSQN